ncbi:PLAT/LH2 domain protein [Onchocerca flexuosa]|uniref:PLAT/LH2 domain protein n=1 Tax=Onchocerca flexuosa TaxID=387005 RepID=A0A238C6U2_9BILA|nr:PLAT/LH2 domain protein [Onchocerca flexuosa]
MSDPDNGDNTLLWSSSHSTPEQHLTPDIVNPHPPNVPTLPNRQIQNYRTSNRSFTRPYSAKTVFFYKEGDIYFSGLRVPVSKARYRTIESLLDDLNSNISMPFGVRHLTTPRGKTMIKSIDQLQHNGRYIASSIKTPRPLNLSMVEKIQRIRRANRQNKSERVKIPLKLSLIPITSKQILFVLNGKPSRIYRALLNPSRKQTIESLLEEVSEGLQEEFIATKTSYASGKQVIQSVYRENSIERPQRVINNSKMMPLTSMSRLNRRESNDSKNASLTNETKKRSPEVSQHSPVLSSPERSPETGEKTTGLCNAECHKNNELTENDIREESCASKLTESDDEKEAEDDKKEERNDEENETNIAESEEEEEAEEEVLVQNNEEIEEHEAMEEQKTNTAVKEVRELMLATSNDQALDNNETTTTTAPEADFSLNAEENGMTYTVSVITGNRWAADTDLDLFIILYGDLNKSEKHLLRQDKHEPKFQQNRMDSFHIETTKLGLLQKILIGHDRIGYGAGIYIERILVTENIADGRQYLFQCAKWLDSGQVDGKIERTLKTTAFCYLTTILRDSKSTSGRWELILHSGKSDGSGATTSNLNIVGYGNQGSSITTKIYDNRMAKVDFGKIGDLLKVRIEIDGNGEIPNYYLNYVELRDLDTEERTVSYVRKWLKIGCDEKNAQSFREFPVFRAAFEPLNVLSYEGKIKLSSRKQRFLKKSIAYVRIFGEIGETGYFPVDFRCASDLKQELSFKAEAVSVGRIQSTRLYVNMNDIGNEIYEGMQMLQSIYDRQHVTSVSVASDWIAEKVVVRESHHAPYRYVMAVTRVKSMKEENEEVEDDDIYNDIGDVFVELLLSEMEGLSTKTSKKKALSKKKSQWILSMTIGEGSTLIPRITLCAENASAEMTIVATTPTDMIITFQQKAADLSTITKVRIGVDDSQRLNHIPTDDMKLYDSENGDELRFPAINTILTSDSVYEFPAVWPDIPPIPNVVYIITVNSGESSADFDVYLALSGTTGDTGFRKLINDDSDPFQENKMSVFEIEAVSIGEPLSTTITVKNEDHNLKWKCEQVHVLDSETNLFYVFKFNEMFTEKIKSQQVLLD